MNVSVIMPVYNADKYVSDAIESLLSQTNKNWILLCIDDGSTDNSVSIIEDYVKKDSRIQLIKQKNTGPGIARSKAISIANTDFISILDSDDAYPVDYIEKMLDRAKETNAEIIVPDVKFGYGNTRKIPNMFSSNNLSTDLIFENGEDAFALTFPWKLHGWIMIKTSLAKKYYTYQNLSYSNYNSDEYITRLLYLKSKRTALCNVEYQYRISPDSITRKPTLRKLDYFKTLDKLLDLCECEGINNNVVLDIFNDYYVSIIDMMKMINQFSINEKKIGLSIIKSYYKSSYKKRFKKRVLEGSTLRTKIKFILSLSNFLYFKLISI